MKDPNAASTQVDGHVVLTMVVAFIGVIGSQQDAAGGEKSDLKQLRMHAHGILQENEGVAPATMDGGTRRS
ncbi:hypothetical protein KKC22_14305, partial [Myxococcota bacterium]|nr:hypothetical protein [Myxococcota bacterium]